MSICGNKKDKDDKEIQVGSKNTTIVGLVGTAVKPSWKQSCYYLWFLPLARKRCCVGYF